MASKNDDDNDLLEDKKEDRILDCAIHYVRIKQDLPLRIGERQEKSCSKACCYGGEWYHMPSCATADQDALNDKRTLVLSLL